MTHNFVMGCFESLWHYGLPSSPPPISSQISTYSAAQNRFPSNYMCTDRDSCSSTPCPLADAGSLRRLFNVLDEDGDGRLSLREMCSLVAKLGMSSHIADINLLSLIHSTLSIHQHEQISRTHDFIPSLDFPQFAQLYASLFAASQDCPLTQNPAHQDADEDELIDAFQVYDTNRDGFISAAELAAVLLELGLLPAASDQHRHAAIDAHLGTCQAYIESVDLDGNGMVDLQEFKAMMNMNMHNNIPPTSWRTCSPRSCCATSKTTGVPLDMKHTLIDDLGNRAYKSCHFVLPVMPTG